MTHIARARIEEPGLNFEQGAEGSFCSDELREAGYYETTAEASIGIMRQKFPDMASWLKLDAFLFS